MRCLGIPAATRRHPLRNLLARIRDGLRERRNQWVADPRLRRLVLSNPLTRCVARHKALELFDVCAGFVYSQILLACLQLGLFDLLKGRAVGIDRLAREIDLPGDRARLLVDAAIALRLLERRDGGLVTLGELGAALNANPGVKAMVHHHADLYADLRDPVALLRNEQGGGRLKTYWAYVATEDPALLSADHVAPYSTLMATSQHFIADEVLSAYPVTTHRRLLDVGGGDGAFAIAAARCAPALEVQVFDLPAVAQRAHEKFRAQGLSDRATAIGGDFTKDTLPVGADLITLVRVLYDHDDDRVLKILKAVRVALPEDGKLLIAEPMAEAPGAERVGDAYFGFYLLAMGSGRIRRPREIGGLLSAAGFVGFRVVPTRIPLQTGLIIANA